MNMTMTMPENTELKPEAVGLQLAMIREKKGYPREYIAGKLHLRVKVIELLEGEDYSDLPEPVFVKGYLRAYAQLLGLPPEPFIVKYNAQYSEVAKPEKALWQSKRESNKGEIIVRWITAFVAIAAIAAVSFWWQNNKEAQPTFSANSAKSLSEKTLPVKGKDADVKLTDLSKMQSMFTASNEDAAAETAQ